MKRYFTIVIALFFVTTVFAQKNEVTNAYLGYTHYQKEKDPAELAKAKIAIDKACLDPSTSGDAKTWLYRGQIYLALYQKEMADKIAAHKDITEPAKKSAAGFLETPTTNIVEATNAFLKSKQLDTKMVYSDQIGQGLNDCYYDLQNAGITRFNQKMYADAEPVFELAADIPAASKKFDTLNMNNAASAAYNGKMFDKAGAMYKKLADVGYGKGNTWLMLARVYAEGGDSAKYKTTVAEGLKKYPSDGDLLTEDVNIKMASGNATEAINELNALVAQRPNDSQLNFVVGNVYDRMANPKKGDGTDAPKPANYEELLNKAATYYKKAIELDAKNFEATYNLGVLYYNQSVEYYNRSMSTIADAAKYQKMYSAPLTDAAKYLEAAHALDPKDMTTLQALKACYGQMGDDANYNRIKDEIKKMQSGQ